MLSYQHIYHAGNLADVHKHALLAWILHYVTKKDKPLTYFETHAGRGIYDLESVEARKTGEAVVGIKALQARFENHPYGQVLSQINRQYGESSYPGSPMIAATILRAIDKKHVCELHPKEFVALRQAMSSYAVKCHNKDGFVFANSFLPPTPRRGVMMIDPSYEIKAEYEHIPNYIERFNRQWNVGIIILWYPILTHNSHFKMLSQLGKNFPQALQHEVSFAPAKGDHGMIGSGMFIINPPYGIDQVCKNIDDIFLSL